jgi:hypothetical protein
MTDEHDGDSTSPDLGAGDEPTAPGSGPVDVFVTIAASLNRTVAALRSLAEVGSGLRGDGRRRFLWALALKLGELGDLAHDTRRAILKLIREEFP